MDNQAPNGNWRPEFIYSATETGKARFNQLVDQPGVLVFDEIHSQLKELIKLSNPQQQFTAQTMEAAIQAQLGELSFQDYGVWVYYSWSNRLVHLLDEAEFVKLKTDRNRNKITTEEQAIFLTKKVGLIGLSVGNAVAVTMAMERCFGELRIADFDELELSNLNRIRTGVHNLGVSKAICTAREIMEIDPFLKVTCYLEGITKENMDAFLTEGGTLDLLIDECDSLDVKVNARLSARALGIPVVMETSDRGMLDIERFDLEPERPILHGLTGDLSLEKLETMKTSEEKLPYVLAMVGYDTISERLKSSLPEIGKSLMTWPQLASDVAAGGGAVTQVARHIFLGTHQRSGRFYVDLDQVIEN